MSTAATGSITITPGYTIGSANEPITHTKLNALGNPVGALDPQSVGAEHVVISEIQSALGSGAAGENFLFNPAFAWPLWRSAGPLTCPNGLKTTLAEYWIVIPTGAAVTQERSMTGPAAATLSSLQVNGAAGLTGLDISQELAAHIGARLNRDFTVSLWLYNATGSALSPTLRIETADALNNFTSVTYRWGQTSATSAATSAWTKLTWTVPGATLGSLANGVRVTLRVPTTNMNLTSRHIRVADVKLEWGAQASEFVPPLDLPLVTGSGDATLNYFPTSSMAEESWLFAGQSLTTTAEAYNYAVMDWFVRPTGGQPVISRGLTNGSGRNQGCMVVTGATSTNAVVVGTVIPADKAAQAGREMTISAYIYNGTGATVTPTLTVETPSTANGFGFTVGLTTALNVALAACPSSAWTRVSYTVNVETLTNYVNGLRIGFNFASGTLDAGGKSIRFADPQFRPGASAAAVEAARYEAGAGLLLPGMQQGLTIQAVGGSASFTVNVRYLALEDAAGRVRMFRRPSSASAVTVNLGSVGPLGTDDTTIAPSAYFAIWAIAGESGLSFVASANFNAPVLTSNVFTQGGFVYRQLIGAGYNNTGNVDMMRQDGYETNFQAGNPSAPVFTLTQGLAYNSTALTGLPLKVKTIWGTVGATTASSNCRFTISPCGTTPTGGGIGTAGIGEQIFDIGYAGAIYKTYAAAAPFRIQVPLDNGTSKLIYAVMSSATTPNAVMTVSGFSIYD